MIILILPEHEHSRNGRESVWCTTRYVRPKDALPLMFLMSYLQATLRFPFLNGVGQPYDHWVIKDLITLCLKYLQVTSGKDKKSRKKGKTTRQPRNDVSVGENSLFQGHATVNHQPPFRAKYFWFATSSNYHATQRRKWTGCWTLWRRILRV